MKTLKAEAYNRKTPKKCGYTKPFSVLIGKKYRIGIDVRKFKDFGIGTYIKTLLTEFSTLSAEAPDFILFHSPGDAEEIQELGDFELVEETSPKYSLRELFSLSRHAGRKRLDILHCPHYVVPFFPPCSTIVTIHDLIHILFPEQLRHRAEKYYAEFMLSRAVKLASRIITGSDYSKRDLDKHFGPLRDKTSVVYHGVGPEFHPIDKAECRERLKRKYGIERPFILYSGSFRVHKNVDGLIRAFRHFRKAYKDHYPELSLVLAGRVPPSGDELRRLTEAPELSRRVYFIKAQILSDIPYIYNAAELFVFLSRHEGFGLPPLEVAACGVPVIYSDRASLPEVMQAAGMPVNPDETEKIAEMIFTLMSDEKLKADLTKKGLQRASYFTPEKTAMETLKIYEEVIKSGSS